MSVSLRNAVPALLLAVALVMPGQALAMKKNTPPPQDPPPPAASSSSSSSSASTSTRSGRAPVRRQTLSVTADLVAGDRQRRAAEAQAEERAAEMEQQGRLLRGDFTTRRTAGLSSAERAQRIQVGDAPASGSSFFDVAYFKQLAEYRQQQAVIASFAGRAALTRGESDALKRAVGRQAELANGLARNGVTLVPSAEQEDAMRRLVAADGDFTKLSAGDRTLVDGYVAENLANTDHWREKFRGTIVDQKRGEDEQERAEVARTMQSREGVQARNARFDRQLRGDDNTSVASASSTSQSIYDVLPGAPVTIEDDYGNLPPPTESPSESDGEDPPPPPDDDASASGDEKAVERK